MSKYDSLKAWRLVKARIAHQCDACDKIVEVKQQYWAEYLSQGVRLPPGITLGKLCNTCYIRRHAM
jgi:hypothetical protein